MVKNLFKCRFRLNLIHVYIHVQCSDHDDVFTVNFRPFLHLLRPFPPNKLEHLLFLEECCMILTSSGCCRHHTTPPKRAKQRGKHREKKPVEAILCACVASPRSNRFKFKFKFFFERTGILTSTQAYHSAYQSICSMYLLYSGDITVYQALGMVSMLSQAGCGYLIDCDLYSSGPDRICFCAVLV